MSGTATREGAAAPPRAPVKAFPTYFGGKDAAGSAEQIIRAFPPHSLYVELFLGGGAVLRRKVPALASIGVDADARVVARWRAVQWPGLTVLRGDALQWLDRHGAALPADALVYADPPYPHAARTSRNRYRHELTDAEHAALLDKLKALRCSVVVSSYANELYARALAGWEHTTYRSMTRGGVRMEHLWSRTAAGVGASWIGADPRYVGRDYRERERIKRKVQRWERRFAAMPAGERTAILHALLNKYGSADTAARGGAASNIAGVGGGRSSIVGGGGEDRTASRGGGALPPSTPVCDVQPAPPGACP